MRLSIETDDMCKYIARNCSLTIAQVQECFDTYYNIILALTQSEERPENFCVPIPKIGRIEFHKVKGRKKGTYYVPLGKHGTGIQTYEIEEDLPDYERVCARLNRRLNDEVKRITKDKALRLIHQSQMTFGGEGEEDE